MQKGQASISRVKATDREGDAARKEISFNCVAYHQPPITPAHDRRHDGPKFAPTLALAAVSGFHSRSAILCCSKSSQYCVNAKGAGWAGINGGAE